MHFAHSHDGTSYFHLNLAVNFYPFDCNSELIHFNNIKWPLILRFSIHSAFIKRSYNQSLCQVSSFLIQFHFISVHLRNTYNAMTFWNQYVILLLFQFFLDNFFNFFIINLFVFLKIFHFFFFYPYSSHLFNMVVKSPYIFSHPLTLFLELFLPTQLLYVFHHFICVHIL